MDCDRVQNLLEPYFENTLKKTESIDVKRHLAICLHCRKDLDDIKTTVRLIESLPHNERTLLVQEIIGGADEEAQSIWGPKSKFRLIPVYLVASICFATAIYLIVTLLGKPYTPPYETGKTELVRGAKAVSESKGDFLVKLKGGDVWQKPPSNTYLVWGDSIKTQAGKNAHLKFTDGLEINLNEETTLILNNDIPNSFFLESGAINAQTNSMEQIIQINTVAGKIKTQETGLTNFSVKLEGGEIMQPSIITNGLVAILTVSVMEGALMLETVYGEKEIKAGEKVVQNTQEEQKKKDEEKILQEKVIQLVEDIRKANESAMEALPPGGGMMDMTDVNKNLEALHKLGRPAIPIIDEIVSNWDDKNIKPFLAQVEKEKGLTAGVLYELLVKGRLWKTLGELVGKERIGEIEQKYMGANKLKWMLESELSEMMVEAGMPALFSSNSVYNSFTTFGEKGDYKNAQECLSKDFSMISEGNVLKGISTEEINKLLQKELAKWNDARPKVGGGGGDTNDSSGKKAYKLFYWGEDGSMENWNIRITFVQEAKRVWKIEKIEFK